MDNKYVYYDPYYHKKSGSSNKAGEKAKQGTWERKADTYKQGGCRCTKNIRPYK
jgi:hypothetical protein